MKKLSYLCILVFILNFIGCIPTKNVQTFYIADNFQITSLNNKRVKVSVMKNVNVNEFKNAFEREYKTQENFLEEFKQQLKEKLGSCANIIEGNNEETEGLVAQSFTDESIKKTKELFESSEEDYILLVKNVIIHNEVNTSSTAGIPTGNGLYTGGGTSYSEDCIVTINVEIWDVKEKRKTSDFLVSGKSTVFLFFYGTTLKNAVDNSLKNLANYIKENQTNS